MKVKQPRPLKARPLSKYMAALERATCNFITDDDLAATLGGPKDIVLVLIKDANKTSEGRVRSVTHEIIHQVHHLGRLEDPVLNAKQEDFIEDLEDYLVSIPEWNMAVLRWLEQELYSDLIHKVGGSA